eukprot:6994124-Prymnesium_polylepis.1
MGGRVHECALLRTVMHAVERAQRFSRPAVRSRLQNFAARCHVRHHNKPARDPPTCAHRHEGFRAAGWDFFEEFSF